MYAPTTRDTGARRLAGDHEKIFKIYNGYWFWGRPSTEELWQDLRVVGQKVRPDWDLGAPGLREAWDAGDKSRFYPYEGERWWS